MFSNKRIRCHILDRTDQLESAKWQLNYLRGKTNEIAQEKLDAIEAANRKHETHLLRLADAEKFVNDLEATMHIHWLENPPY